MTSIPSWARLERVKRVAKTLHQICRDELDNPIRLSECQEIAARLMGYADFHGATSAKLSPGFVTDADMTPEDHERRALDQLEFVSVSLGTDLALACDILNALQPNADERPKTLKQATADNDLNTPVLQAGELGLHLTGAGESLGDMALRAIQAQHMEKAAKLAEVALQINPNSLSAHEASAFLASDLMGAAHHHMIAGVNAWKLYRPEWKCWQEAHPKGDPCTFWGDEISHPILRTAGDRPPPMLEGTNGPHPVFLHWANFARTLVKAVLEGETDPEKGYRTAIAIFSRLISLNPARSKWLRRDRTATERHLLDLLNAPEYVPREPSSKYN